MSAVMEALIEGVSDWRVNLQDPLQSVVFPGQQLVNSHLQPHAVLMANAIERHVASNGTSTSSFLLNVGSFRYRVQRIRQNLFAARKIVAVVPKLENLGFRKEQVETLLSADLQRTGGLIVIFGNTGAGKTTTASAMVSSRLEQLGGYCLSVEDPPEYPLEGFYGKSGYCEQMDASSVGYERALIDSLRCFPSGRPSMLMLGEIRSSVEAYEVMQIALDGHLVITTMHAKDIVSGLIRLVSLAGVKGDADVRSMLSSSLTLVTHQSIANNVPNMQMLKMNQTSSAIIQNGAIFQLQDEILKQNRVPERRGNGGLFRGDRTSSN